MFWVILLLILVWIGDIVIIYNGVCGIIELIKTDHPCLAVMVFGLILFITAIAIVSTISCFSV